MGSRNRYRHQSGDWEGTPAIGETLTIYGEKSQRMTMSIVGVGQQSALRHTVGAQPEWESSLTDDSVAYLANVQYSSHVEFKSGQTVVIAGSSPLFAASADHTTPRETTDGWSSTATGTSNQREPGVRSGQQRFRDRAFIGWASIYAILLLVAIYTLIHAIEAATVSDWRPAIVYGLLALWTGIAAYSHIIRLPGGPSSS